MADSPRKQTAPEKTTPTWEASVIEALRRLGGEAHLSALNAEVKKLREEAGVPLSATWTATIRRTLQFSKQTTQDVAGSGVWRLRDR